MAHYYRATYAEVLIVVLAAFERQSCCVIPGPFFLVRAAEIIKKPGITLRRGCT